MNCFLCGAERKSAEDLAGHFVFWHNAPKRDALTAARQVAAGQPVVINVERNTEPAVWEQLILPELSTEMRSSYSNQPGGRID
jgi:hypothetical protein